LLFIFVCICSSLPMILISCLNIRLTTFYACFLNSKILITTTKTQVIATKTQLNYDKNSGNYDKNSAQLRQKLKVIHNMKKELLRH